MLTIYQMLNFQKPNFSTFKKNERVSSYCIRKKWINCEAHQCPLLSDSKFKGSLYLNKKKTPPLEVGVIGSRCAKRGRHFFSWVEACFGQQRRNNWSKFCFISFFYFVLFYFHRKFKNFFFFAIFFSCIFSAFFAANLRSQFYAFPS